MSKRANAIAARQQKQIIKKNKDSDFKATHRLDWDDSYGRKENKWMPKNWSEITNKNKKRKK